MKAAPFSDEGPWELRGPFSLPSSHQLNKRIHRTVNTKLISSRNPQAFVLEESECGCHVCASVSVGSRLWIGSTVPVNASVLALQQKGGGLYCPPSTRRDGDTASTPLSVCKSATSLYPTLHGRTKLRKPTQLEMAGSIHGECSARSCTSLHYIAQEPASYFLPGPWQGK